MRKDGETSLDVNIAVHQASPGVRQKSLSNNDQEVLAAVRDDFRNWLATVP
jgi:hypothetical protein